MKVIDLLNKIANGEKPPKYILIVGHRYRFNEKTNDYDSDIGMSNKYLFRNMGILSELNEEIKILEDKTEEIEEIQVDRNNFIHTELGSFKGRKMDIAFVNKFNELTKIVNKLNKQQDTSKETNCMTD